MILESCVGNVVDALRAQSNGAHQLELCDRLDLDGTSPPRELVAAVCQAVAIPVKVILNPVPFEYTYSDQQLDGILNYMASLDDLNVAGFVFGALDQNQMPDLAAVDKIATATQLPITFHKAIDEAQDILLAVDLLAKSKIVPFVLTSGGHPTASQGLSRLIEMRDLLADQASDNGPSMRLIAAGSITSTNLSKLDQVLGLKYYHGKKIVD
jgi:copper homeostasis protein